MLLTFIVVHFYDVFRSKSAWKIRHANNACAPREKPAAERKKGKKRAEKYANKRNVYNVRGLKKVSTPPLDG